jgi:hypothetical protein
MNGIWIRSQDGCTLTVVATVSLEMDSRLQNWDVWADDLLLGTYATKARALDVLDEIHHFIVNRPMQLTGGVLQPVQAACFYQMPKE